MTESLIIPPNTIRAHVVDGVNIVVEDHIRPSPPRRDWMDAVPAGYIYRCIPLLAANTMGWDLLNPADTSLIWDGGNRIENVKIDCESRGRFTANSHFGSGIATWYVPFLFKTSPDLGLYICGPANHDQSDAQPLDAFVRTDWLPFPFTVNISKAAAEGHRPSQDGVYNAQYVKAKGEKGQTPHQTIFKPRDPIDKR